MALHNRHPGRCGPLVKLLLALFLSGVVAPAAAHNGEVALAVPLEQITVDGDFSDWPDGMTRYDIDPSTSFFDSTITDYSGAFRVGYSAAENALYLAVEVRDNVTVVATTAAEKWQSQDGCDVSFNPHHGEEIGRLLHHHVIWGRTRQEFKVAKRADVEVEVQRHQGHYRYEWRLDVSGMSKGQVQLRPGLVVELEVAIMDVDLDVGQMNAFSTWGQRRNNEGNSRGDVLLVEADHPLATVQGRALWEGSDTGIAHSRIVVQSSEMPGQHLHLETDTEGRFDQTLPSGSYELDVADIGKARRKARSIEVGAGDSHPIELTAPAPTGTRVRAGAGRSAKAGPGYRRGAWRILGPSNDLLSGGVYAIHQDRQGHFWFATAEGVVRYDGEYFTSFTKDDGLLHNSVTDIVEDRQGHLWFVTRGQVWLVSGGVSRYDGKTFTSFTMADGLYRSQVFSLLEDRQGHLWFGFWKGVSRYDGSIFSTFTAKDGLPFYPVFSMLEDRRGDLWFGTWGSGASRYDGQNFETVTTADGLANDHVLSMLEDRRGHLWFGTSNGVSRFDGQNFAILDSLEGKAVRCIAEDRWGNLWFGTGEDGLYFYHGEGLDADSADLTGLQLEHFTAENGLPHQTVSSIAEDRQGQIWVGTGQGVAHYGERQFKRFTGADGLAPESVTSMLEDRRGDLWFVGRRDWLWVGGLSRYDGKGLKNFVVEDGLPHRHVYCMLEDDRGDLWFGTEKGVARYDGEHSTAFTPADGLLDDRVMQILQDRQGHLWFGTWSGSIGRYDGQTFKTIPAAEGLAHPILSMLEDRQGHIWFGTWKGGVSRYDGKGFKTFTTRDGLAGDHVASILQDSNGDMWFMYGQEYQYSRGVSRYDGQDFKTFTTQDGLAHNSVSFMLEDRAQNLWFGTQGGVSRYDGQDFKTFTVADGLADDHVIFIMEDRQGHLWFGTQGGGATRHDGFAFQTLDERDGLTHNIVFQIREDRRGDLWFATDGGVTRYRPSQTPPSVRITDVVAGANRGPLAQVDLPSSQSSLALAFQGRSMTTSWDRMVYAYRLQGHDADWRLTRQNQVEYRNLSLGDYVFEVKAIDRDLNYSEEPAQVRIHIHLPYVRLAWISSLALAVLFIAWQARRLVQRDRNLRFANRQLRDAQSHLVQAEKMATIGLLAGGVAHEINNPLQAILNGARRILRYPDDVERHRQSAGLVEQAAHRCGTIVQSLLNYSRKSNVETGPVDLNDVVDNTIDLLHHHVQQAGVELEVHKADLPSIEGNFNELSTVLTNLVINARDAVSSMQQKPGRVEIKTVTAAENVLLQVRDNGPGMPAEVIQEIFDPFFTTKEVGVGTGLGLSIVQGIVERHGGRIEVDSTANEGTTFNVFLPHTLPTS